MKKATLPDSVVTEIEARKERIRESLVKWGRQNFRQFEWRDDRTPYSVLVSEIFLKRTTATAARSLFKEFMCLYPNLQALSQADAEDLERFLLRIGYHKQRTKILIEVSKHILAENRGEIPRSKKDLMQIPNIGDYTANAILSLGYGTASAMVDSNVERILSRIFLKCLPKKPHSLMQSVADLLAPIKDNQNYNYALLDLGALVCRYGIPRCNLCPLRMFCDYYLLGKPHKSEDGFCQQTLPSRP